MVQEKVDLLIIYKTKTLLPQRSSFTRFYSKPYRCDRNNKGRVTVTNGREGILLKPSYIDREEEHFLFELNLRKQKWLIIRNCNLDKTMLKGYLK